MPESVGLQVTVHRPNPDNEGLPGKGLSLLCHV